MTVGLPGLMRDRDAGRHWLSWRYVLVAELLFFLAFAAWAWVRVHDPAANHTEQPMDLMFMNSIWASPAYPPHDAWLSGYAISYYYLGYWMLTTLGRLAGQPPQIAYNVGQASWFGLLLLGSFGVVYNLAARRGPDEDGDSGDGSGDNDGDADPPVHALLGGLLGALAVGVSGNMQVILEWLHANGVDMTGPANWFRVANFPPGPPGVGSWFIDSGWWWWRSSRVIEDLDLLGRHIEVIDEFPIFSYILGDNHPHVLAMPFAILVIGLALNLFYQPRVQAMACSFLTRLRGLFPLGWGGLLLATLATGALVFLNTWDFPPYWLLMMAVAFVVVWRGRATDDGRPTTDDEGPTTDDGRPTTDDEGPTTGDGRPTTGDGRPTTGDEGPTTGDEGRTTEDEGRTTNDERGGESEEIGERGSGAFWGALGTAVAVGAIIVLGAVVIYLPYFLTAQSQAGGFAPNLFNPTRLPQFLLMFAPAILAILALLGLGWRLGRPGLGKLAAAALVIFGAPIAFLTTSALLATRTGTGQALLSRMVLPEGASEYMPFIIERWTGRPFTFLLVGALLTGVVVLVWQILAEYRHTGAPVLFALLLAGIGLLLVYAPEFVYLRDNFGTRMNTVFKFYYQAWLLFGLSGAYAISQALRAVNWRRGASGLLTAAPAALALLLILGGLIFPVAGAYSKTGGFASENPTFDATAYIRQQSPNEAAAIDWVQANTAPGAVVLEGKGASYRADTARVSAATGRQTLLGWDGHESQWRGEAYGEMAAGRPEAIDLIYRSGSPIQVDEALAAWGIDYVYLGPAERGQYGVSPAREEMLAQLMEVVFQAGDVRVYQRRGVGAR